MSIREKFKGFLALEEEEIPASPDKPPTEPAKTEKSQFWFLAWAVCFGVLLENLITAVVASAILYFYFMPPSKEEKANPFLNVAPKSSSGIGK